MNEQQKYYLLQVADMVEYELTDEQFDIGMWMNECGTVGCAIGWATKKLPHIGIRLYFGRSVDLEELEKALGTSSEETLYLFAEEATKFKDVSRLAVARRIRDFAKEKEVSSE